MTDRAQDLARALGLKRTTGEAYYLRALKNYQDGNLEDAILDVSEAIYYDQRYADYYSTRGLFFLTNNQKAEAEEDVRYALRLNKRQWLAYYVLGMLRFQDEDYLAALSYFDDAIKYGQRTQRSELWFYRAVTHYCLGSHEKALQDIDTALRFISAEDKRLKDIKAWKKEIEAALPRLAKRTSKEAKKAAKKGKSGEGAKELAGGATSVSDVAEHLAADAKSEPLPTPDSS